MSKITRPNRRPEFADPDRDVRTESDRTVQGDMELLDMATRAMPEPRPCRLITEADDVVISLLVEQSMRKVGRRVLG